MKNSILLVMSILLFITLVGCDYEISDHDNASGIITESIDNVSDSKTPDSETKEPNKQQNDEAIDKPVVILSDKEIMISQFLSIGLSKEEAETIQETFEKVGITKISNISKFIQGSGLDGEQGFYCDFYSFDVQRDSIRLDFKIVKRKLQIIKISWAHGKNYPDINKYEDMILNEGVKESDYGSYVYLYYKKLKNFAVDEDSFGYRAIYDYETHSVSKYK